MPAADQLPLDLPPAESFEAEDFLVSDANRAAHALLARWPDWPDRVLVLVGPEGAGKSHLAAVWARRAGASRADLAGGGAPPAAPAVLVEDAEAAARGPRAEAALFDLLNAARAGGPFVLLTARAAPAAWGLATPDLLSRLRLAPLARLGAPDEALMRALVVKLFLDRGLVVDTGVVEAMARRLERSFAAARDAVAALDRDALSRGRRVTRAGVAALVGAEAEPDEDAGR